MDERERIRGSRGYKKVRVGRRVGEKREKVWPQKLEADIGEEHCEKGNEGERV